MSELFTYDGKKFGERLKKAIKKANYTQKEFAKQIKSTETTIRSYFNGTMPKADKLFNMAKVLNMSMESLLTDEEVQLPKKTITPKDIISAIDVLTEAYGYEIIVETKSEVKEMDYSSGYTDTVTRKVNAICIKDDSRIQSYLNNLKEKGFLSFELSKVGEEDTFTKLKKQWANITDCIFENGYIYNPKLERISIDSHGQYYVERLPISEMDIEDLPF